MNSCQGRNGFFVVFALNFVLFLVINKPLFPFSMFFPFLHSFAEKLSSCSKQFVRVLSSHGSESDNSGSELLIES